MSFVRAIILGIVLIPINLHWLMHAESLNPPVYSTLFTLFYNVTFTIFVLVVLNALLKKYSPKFAFQPGELLIIYVMLSIGTGIFGHDLMIVLAPTLTAFWFANPVNEWSVLFRRHLPEWLFVSDEKALLAFHEGESTLYIAKHINAWLVPVAIWGSFLIVLLFVLVCMNALIRKQWAENERLSYPVIQLPLELARGGTGLLANPRLWIGFAVAGSLDLINGLHGLFPVFPSFKLVQDLRPLFTTQPWNAIGWTPIAVYPFVVGLGYFLPVNLVFSAWFFHVFWKAELITRKAIGLWSTPGPYRSYTTSGAWMILTLFVLWNSRNYLKLVVRWSIRGTPSSVAANEPMTYQAASLGMILGTITLVLFLAYAGMAVWVAFLFLLIYFLYMVAITRIRAEIGPPAHDAEWMGPEQLLLNSFGASRIGPRNIAMFTRLYWMSRAYRSHPVGHQLEAFRIAQVIRAPSRVFLVAMIIASVVGTFAGFWAYAHNLYGHGAGTGGSLGVEAFRRLQVWLQNPGARNDMMLSEVGLGAGVTIALMVLHQRFVGFPFHPVGYAVACGWVMSAAWFSVFLAWLLKWTILKFGGIRLYRQMVPFFLGVILGQHVVGGSWTIIREIVGGYGYQFFP